MWKAEQYCEEPNEVTFLRAGIIKEWSLVISAEKSEIISALKIPPSPVKISVTAKQEKIKTRGKS